jgi:cell division protein ZapA (FtsZ GTPase activity inhibitor)
MKRDIQNYQVTILGDMYTIASDESEEHVVRCANYVHVLIQEFIQKMPHIPFKTAAIFVALKLASKILKSEDHMRENHEIHSNLIAFLEQEIDQISSRLQ